MNNHKLENVIKTILIIIIILFLLLIKIYHQKNNNYNYKIILTPTVLMVEIFTGYSFNFIDGIGYVSQDEEIIISKKCAGINLLILSIFISLIVGFKNKQKFNRQILKLIFYFIFAFCFTILINAIRISFSINFEPIRRSIDILSRANNWIHHGIGTFIFVSSLVIYYFLIKRSESWITKRII